MPLVASLSEKAPRKSSRLVARRTLSLEVPALASGHLSTALVHNLSEHGLRVETDSRLSVGEVIRVELPEAGSMDARVVWAAGGFAGCRFHAPIPKATVSAALLRSPARGVDHGDLLPTPRLIEPEQALEIERIEAECEQWRSSNALLLVALLISLAVSALFAISLFKMAVPG